MTNKTNKNKTNSFLQHGSKVAIHSKNNLLFDYIFLICNLLLLDLNMEIMAMSESSRKIAGKLNRKHRTNITHETVAKLIVKFKKLNVEKIKEETIDHGQQTIKTQQLRIS